MCILLYYWANKMMMKVAERKLLLFQLKLKTETHAYSFGNTEKNRHEFEWVNK